MFHVVAVDGVFQSEDGPSNAMIVETQRQLTEALQQVSDWPLIERRRQRASPAKPISRTRRAHRLKQAPRLRPPVRPSRRPP